jgi:hypothetical protein
MHHPAEPQDGGRQSRRHRGQQGDADAREKLGVAYIKRKKALTTKETA